MTATDTYTLGLDLDNCVADYTATLRNEMLTTRPELTPFDMPEPSSYDFTVAGWPFEGITDFLDYHNTFVAAGMFSRMSMIAGAAEGVRKLRENGVRVRIVTHRIFDHAGKAAALVDTVKWLEENGIEYDSLCFDGNKGEIHCDSFIDDAPSNIEAIRANGTTHCFAFDQLYNRELEGPRVYSWNDAVEKVLEHKASIGK